MPPRPLRAVPDAPIGAVLYIRQSITDDDSISEEIQETAGRQYCERFGYHVVGKVVDLNRTGRSLRRRKVQEAIGYVERGEARIIVVWKWSRLSRNRRDFAITCDAIEVLGGRVESSTEPADTTTAIGRLNRGVLAEFAAFESDRIGEIIKEVQDNRVSRGLPGNGKPRFGYRNIDKRFAPDPDTGPILADMYARYIGGAGYSAIASWLNDLGVLTTYGGHWRHETVRSVLNSGFAAGLMQHRGQLVPGIHEPVITAEQWQRYLEVRDGRFVLPSRAKSSRYLLVGLIRCGACGDVMTARPDRYRHVWYRCKSRTLRRCTNGMVKLVEVEPLVFDWLHDLVDDIDAAAAVQARRDRKTQSARQRLAGLKRQIGELDKALTRLTVDRAKGLVPDQAYADARDEILTSRTRLVEDQAEAERSATVGPRLDVAEYRGLLKEWDTLPVEARRQALRRIIRRVRVWSHPRPCRVDVVPTWEDETVPSEKSGC